MSAMASFRISWSSCTLCLVNATQSCSHSSNVSHQHNNAVFRLFKRKIFTKWELRVRRTSIILIALISQQFNKLSSRSLASIPHRLDTREAIRRRLFLEPSPPSTNLELAKVDPTRHELNI